MIDEIGSSTIMGCGFALFKAGDHSEDQRVHTPSVPAPRPTPSQPAASTSTSSQQQLHDEITALKSALQADQELNAKRHADLLALLTALHLSIQLLEITLPHLFLPICILPLMFLIPLLLKNTVLLLCL